MVIAAKSSVAIHALIVVVMAEEVSILQPVVIMIAEARNSRDPSNPPKP